MAFPFTKKDLQYEYDWKAKDEGDNPKIIGFPDSYYLNRSEGYEVLPFIVRFLDNHSFTEGGKDVATSVAHGQKVERMLHAGPRGKHSCMVPEDSGVALGSVFKARLWEKYHMAAPAQRRQLGSLSSKVQKAYKS